MHVAKGNLVDFEPTPNDQVQHADAASKFYTKFTPSFVRLKGQNPNQENLASRPLQKS